MPKRAAPAKRVFPKKVAPRRLTLIFKYQVEAARLKVKRLSRRQKEIAQAISLGLTSIEIADRLGVSRNWVRKILLRIRRKWDVPTTGIGQIWFLGAFYGEQDYEPPSCPEWIKAAIQAKGFR
jgi:DNA-binding CsgD family transcriptional regulator